MRLSGFIFRLYLSVFFRNSSGVCKITDYLNRIISDCSFSRYHYRSSTVSDGIENITYLRTRRNGILFHACEHLRHYHKRLAVNFAFFRNLLLDLRQVPQRHCITQVSAGNDYLVGRWDKFVEAIYTVHIFNLGKEPDVTAAGSVQFCPYDLQVFPAAYKRLHDCRDSVFGRAGDILNIRRCHRWRVNIYARNCNALSAGEDSPALNRADCSVFILFDYGKKYLPVVKQHLLSRAKERKNFCGNWNATRTENYLTGIAKNHVFFQCTYAKFRPLHIYQQLSLFPAFLCCRMQNRYLVCCLL